ncbi:MAG: hypothetical protein ACYTG2_17530 [Planctomycetota bacterium]|jgi:hypothetical protein
MMIYKDPLTGEFVPAPAGAFAGQLTERTETSSVGLLKFPSPVPGGGDIVRLDGRFQNFVKVAVDDEGGIHTTCDHDAALSEPEEREE